MNDWNPADDLRLEDWREPEFVEEPEEGEEPRDWGDGPEFEHDLEWEDD